MTKYYILAKKKSAKKWTKVIPIRKGTSLKKINSFRKNRFKGHRTRIVPSYKLLEYLKKVTKFKK